jgi:hypothetical protein
LATCLCVDETRRNQSVGRLLPHRIGQIMKELGYRKSKGYEIWVNPSQENGVDLKMSHHDRPILVVEVLNWCIRSKLNYKRKGNIIRNLTEYECKRVLISTPFANEEVIQDLPRFGISLLKLSFQILPRLFYEDYASRHQVELRMIDSRETTQNIKAKLEQFLGLPEQ